MTRTQGLSDPQLGDEVWSRLESPGGFFLVFFRPDRKGIQGFEKKNED